MSYASEDFSKSMMQLQRKHKRRSKASGVKRGVMSSVNHDGIVVARSRRKSGESPVLGILFFVGVFMLFKAYTLASDGAEAYGERVESFREGTKMEQTIGWAMQADPVTKAIAGYFTKVTAE
ncbi:MAG: hypothetical protein AAGD04_09455 [Pseudomonadota bacterium]